jgi:ElaB/YqjD/DUF883 family membrane-anchored ribosome-binding protein
LFHRSPFIRHAADIRRRRSALDPAATRVAREAAPERTHRVPAHRAIARTHILPQGCRCRGRDYNRLRVIRQSLARPFLPPKEFTMSNSSERTREKVVEEFSNVLYEAEQMLKDAAGETGDKARNLRDQVESKLLHAKLRMQELEGQAVDRAKVAARVTDDYVHDHPWQSIGMAAAIGFVVGLLLNRR